MATLYQNSEQQIQDLPDNWEKRTDMRTGLPFFLNHTDKFTTWDDPRVVSQPRGMINPILRQSSPTPQKKFQPMNTFFKPSFDDDFFRQGFNQSTLPRGRRGVGPRFVDMDPWFHQTMPADEPEEMAPTQPMWSTLGRRNHRTKPKLQPEEPPTQSRRRVGHSEPPCEERLYGRPNNDYRIPVQHAERHDNPEPAVRSRNSPPIEENENHRPRSPFEQRMPRRNIFTRRASAPQEPHPVLGHGYIGRKPSEPVIPSRLQPPSSNHRVDSPVHAEETFREERESDNSGLQSQISVEEHGTSNEQVPVEKHNGDKIRVDQAEVKEPEPQVEESEEVEEPEPSAEEQAEHQRQVEEAFDRIQTIRSKVDEYKLQVSDFTGSQGSKDYRYLNEMLTRATLDLDKIDSLGESEVRLKRKAVIKYIDLCTDQLESKCQ